MRRVWKLLAIGLFFVAFTVIVATLPIVYTVIVGFFSILVACFVIFRRTDIERTEKWGSFLQSIATILAIAAAVYLYHIERRSQPHADVTQTVQVAALRGGDGVAIEAYVTVKNLGTQLLKLEHINSRLEAIDVRVLGSGNFLKLEREDYQNAVGRIDGKPAVLFEATELQWRQLRFFDRDIHHEIEPGESDLIIVTFVLPCPVIRNVRVATDITKPRAGKLFVNEGADGQGQDKHQRQHALLWKTRSMVDLEPACGKLE